MAGPCPEGAVSLVTEIQVVLVWQRAPLSQDGAGRERSCGRFPGPEE